MQFFPSIFMANGQINDQVNDRVNDRVVWTQNFWKQGGGRLRMVRGFFGDRSTLRLFFLGSIFCVLGSLRIFAADYYIDSLHGDDSRAGTSPETAWKSLEKVNATDFLPGDSVLFKKGGLWRGTLFPKSGEEGRSLLYASYGSGDEKPRFYCSVSLTNPADWTQEGERLWRTRSETSTLPPLGLTTDVGNLILEGNRAGFKRWSKDELKQENDFWFDLDEHCLWFYGDQNPAKQYSAIEAALRVHGVDMTGCHHVIFDGLDVRYAAAHGFGGSGNHHITIRRCDISWIGGGDQYLQGGAGRRVRFGNGIEFWENAQDHLVEENHLWEIYDAALTNQGSSNNRQINIHYRNNRIENCEYSFEFWNRGPESQTRNILFEGNVCSSAGYGWGHVQRPDPNGRHLMFYNNSSQTSDFVVRENVFDNASESLVRRDNDWPGLILNHNRYLQKAGRPLFSWFKKNYDLDAVEEFRTTFGVESEGSF